MGHPSTSYYTGGDTSTEYQGPGGLLKGLGSLQRNVGEAAFGALPAWGQASLQTGGDLMQYMGPFNQLEQQMGESEDGILEMFGADQDDRDMWDGAKTVAGVGALGAMGLGYGMKTPKAPQIPTGLNRRPPTPEPWSRGKTSVTEAGYEHAQPTGLGGEPYIRSQVGGQPSAAQWSTMDRPPITRTGKANDPMRGEFGQQMDTASLRPVDELRLNTPVEPQPLSPPPGESDFLSLRSQSSSFEGMAELKALDAARAARQGVADTFIGDTLNPGPAGVKFGDTMPPPRATSVSQGLNPVERGGGIDLSYSLEGKIAGRGKADVGLGQADPMRKLSGGGGLGLAGMMAEDEEGGEDPTGEEERSFQMQQQQNEARFLEGPRSPYSPPPAQGTSTSNTTAGNKLADGGAERTEQLLGEPGAENDNLVLSSDPDMFNQEQGDATANPGAEENYDVQEGDTVSGIAAALLQQQGLEPTPELIAEMTQQIMMMSPEMQGVQPEQMQVGTELGLPFGMDESTMGSINRDPMRPGFQMQSPVEPPQDLLEEVFSDSFFQEDRATTLQQPGPEMIGGEERLPQF